MIGKGKQAEIGRPRGFSKINAILEKLDDDSDVGSDEERVQNA